MTANPNGDYLGTFWISATEAAHTLWHYGDGGMEPGDFTKALLETIARADHVNRARLGTVFPGYVAACNIAEYRDDAVAVLTDIAASRSHVAPVDRW